MKNFIYIAVFFAVFLNISIVSGYEITTIFQDDTTTDNVIELPSFYWNGECTANITIFATSTNTGDYTLNNRWYNPNETLVQWSLPTLTSNIDCRNMGSATGTTSLNDFYEARTTTVSTATTTDTWAKAEYTCTENSDLIITYSNTSRYDAYGYYPYSYVEYTGGYCAVGAPGSIPSVSAQMNQIIRNIELSYNEDCGTTGLLEKYQIGSASSTCASSRFYGTTMWTYAPFNSGGAGVVNITMTSINPYSNGSCTMSCGNQQIQIYDTVLNTTTDYSTTLPANLELNLIEDRDYFLFIGTRCTGTTGGSACYMGLNNTDYSISIYAYEPEWNCSDWTDCEDNIQQRTCTDPLNRIPNRIETRACLGTFDQVVNIGFEARTSYNVWNCRYGLFCQLGAFLRDPARYYPTNWTVTQNPYATDNTTSQTGYLHDVLEVTNDDASDGSYSLKMWYIPPTWHLPVTTTEAYNNTQVICDANITQGRSPYVQRDLNETTVWVSYNITAFSPYMSFSFDARKCDNVERQHGVCFEIFGQPIIGQENCYSYNGSCITEPEGRLRANVFDLTENTTILDIILKINNTEFREGQYLYRLNDLTFNNTYRISFSVEPEFGRQDNTPYCSYIDNVDINFAEIEYVCTDTCTDDYDGDGLNDYTLTFCDEISSEQFVTKIIPMSRECVPSDLVEFVDEVSEDPNEIVEQYSECYEGTLYAWNSETQEFDIIGDSEVCETEEEETDQYTDALFEHEGEFAWIFGRFFLSMMAMLIISAFITIKTDEVLLGLLSAIAFTFVFTYIGYFPIEIGLLVGIGEALMIAKTLRDEIG